MKKVMDAVKQGDTGPMKVIGVGVFLLIVVILLIVRVGPMLSSPKPTQELKTPGWTLVKEYNEQLISKPAFADTQFAVVEEQPLKLVVRGSVRNKKDLDELKAFLKTLRPEATDEDLAVEVEIRK